MDVNELLTRGVTNIIPGKIGLEKLLSEKKLNVYLGIDPTSTKIHLGHAVSLRKLQAFADMGHHVTFLIGDFTALIGDTSDKDTERPTLTKEEIRSNFETYKSQAEKIVDFSKVEVKHNSEWLGALSFEEIVKLCQQFSFGDFASRELIKKRLSEGKHVGLHEALYPVMQGYDSYFLDTDVQIGGADQTFNMQAGRTLQKALRNEESYVVATDYLLGTDGRKMSKTWGNAIWLDDTPQDMYGKVMSLKDDLIIPYFTLATRVSMEEISEMSRKLLDEKNPMDYKKKLARQIVSELYTEDEAESAQRHFEATVQGGEMPEDIPTFEMSIDDHVSVAQFMVQSGLAVSTSEAKRLIEQGGVSVDENPVTNVNEDLIPADNSVVRVGKRRYVRIKIR